ncbi:MAG TPA: PD-(D/E)XK nuclease family protein, partial [Opitutaceae bacterium]
AGAPPEDTQVQRSLAAFYERGCRMEELLALWPLLCALNLARISPGRARATCQRLFDELPSHGIDTHVDRLEKEGDVDGLEVARVARLVLPAWPKELTLSDALTRFEAARDRLAASVPAGWQELREFARRAQEPMPATAILETIRAFLPEKGPVEGTPPRGGFAHVTLTTVRRAAGVAWSHAILAESNAGAWPSRRESSCWLDDEARRELNARGRFSLGLATTDDRASLERGLWSAVARDTSQRVIFSASLHDEEDPERALEPNPWLERVMWSKGYLSADSGGRESFGALAGSAARADASGAPGAQGAWFSIWNRRRDPAAPFDEYFFADPSGDPPTRISARQIERGARDPVRLWFDEVLRVRRVDWGTFRRARGRMMGTAVHRVMAVALRGAPHEGAFSATPQRPEAQVRLAAELSALRARWPRDRYWESLFLDVSGAAQELLDLVFRLPAAPFAATELRLPESATVDTGSAGPLAVSGRPDLVLSDRPALEGARVSIVDFKTGGDAKLSGKTMASTGASLQLGVYLEAARSLGATGAVLMLKPGKPPSMIEMDGLGDAVAKLGVLGQHLSTGIYGALTPDRDEYTVVFEWPLACAPIGHAILKEKFERTFGAAAAAGSEEAADE